MLKFKYTITTKFDNSICYCSDLETVKEHIKSEAFRLGRNKNEFIYSRRIKC